MNDMQDPALKKSPNVGVYKGSSTIQYDGWELYISHPFWPDTVWTMEP